MRRKFTLLAIDFDGELLPGGGISGAMTVTHAAAASSATLLHALEIAADQVRAERVVQVVERGVLQLARQRLA